MGEELTPEWLLLERCIPIFGGQAGLEALHELIAEGALHWGDVLHQALRHQILPLLAHTLCHPDLISAVPPEIQELLITSLRVNRRVLDVGYAIIQETIKALQAEKIAFVVTKGYVLDELIYRSLRIRKTSDIDLIVAPADKQKVSRVLAELGYTHGHFDATTGQIVALSAQIKQFYAMLSDSLPEFVRLHPDPIVQCVYLDVGCSLTWFNAQYKIPVADVLATRTTIQTTGAEPHALPSLDPEHQLIYTALHLFKEAWVEHYGIKDGNDVSLAKFTDIYLLAQQHDRIDRARLAALIDRYAIAKPMLWVLTHTERVFQADLCGKLGLTASVSESWLASWQMRDQTLSYWKGSMRERLQSKQRRALFL